MVVFYQIVAFYMLLLFVTTGLIGYYPKMDAEFASIPVLQNHPAFHMTMGKISSIGFMTMHILALIFLIVEFVKLKKVFPNARHSIKEYERLRLNFGLGLVFAVLGMVCGKLPWLMGNKVLAGGMSAQAHFHSNATFFLLMCVFFLLTSNCLEKIGRSRKFMEIEAGKRQNNLKFLWDNHARKFSLALKFLFLGVNVWWPYLLLKYGFGLAALNGLYFLPIHLAGVIPFSILKRKHKFQRTINSKFQGNIKKKEKYQTCEEVPEGYQLRAI